MEPDTNLPVVAVINDLEALISEIDNNPRLSSWVVRLVLKSIKDKARKMMKETASQPVSLNEPMILEAFLHAAPTSTPKLKALQPQ